MRFNINPKELLALHNLLFEKFESEESCRHGDHFAEGDPRAVPDVQLRQIYGRLKAVLLGALSGRGVHDPIDQVFKREQAKIDRLRLLEELDADPDDDERKADEPKKKVAEYVGGKDDDGSFLKLDEDDDVFTEPYPRKGGNHRGPRGGARNKR